MGFDGKTGTGYDKPGGDPQVKELQQVLSRLGFTDAQGKPLAADGKFGPKTMAAVQAMQQKYGGMASDGKVTPELLARLKSAAGSKPTKAPARAKESVDVDEATTEDTDHIEGHVTESLGTDAAGGRVFRVRIIREGTSRNRKRYTESVLRKAASLYNGAKCYDHHRTPQEMQTSTVQGLVGGYRNVAYEGDGLYGNLHLFPSATHTAEALDAAINAQAAGLPPLVGISHDVHASFKAGAPTSGGHVQEAVAITRVNSADVVADPSAGGQATRVLAGGIETEEEEPVVTITTPGLLDALKTASAEELAAVREALQPVHTTEATVESFLKDGWTAKAMVGEKLKAAGLPETVRESVIAALPERVTESDVDAQIAGYKTMLAGLERAGLAPTVTTTVVKESFDKKVEALDAFFNGDFTKGYRSFRGAYEDFTGKRQAHLGGEDFSRQILRESFDAEYTYVEQRATESMTSSSWNLVLGDSVTRRLVAAYRLPGLDVWREFVSSVVPVSDFRTQRIDRIGGYGVLPVVGQGAPYQPLPSPGNEEVTYAIAKRGGTEDVTLEMIANDDVRAISKIPVKLGRAAARTLYLFVMEMLRPSTGTYAPFGTAGNPTIYDSVALYHASHGNTTTTALSQTALTVSRAKMRTQAAYGDAVEILGATPKFLLAPPSLEELAFQLCSSAVAIPATPAGPSNTPNIHQGLQPRIIDYWESLSSTQWALVGDPNDIPTIEIGFYQGRQEPELFTQSDPSVGSVFNADKWTWKIRHIYSGAQLDYRGVQRGNT